MHDVRSDYIFDPAKFSKRLNQMSIQAREIVTYMESLGYKGMHEVFEQYRKQAFEQSKSLDGGKYYRYKQDAFRIVDVYFVGNKNLTFLSLYSITVFILFNEYINSISISRFYFN